MRDPSRVEAHPILVARPGTVEDAEAMARVAYQAVAVPPDQGREECARIVGEPFGFSVVVTRQVGKSPPEIVGVQNGALVRPWFSESIRDDVRPFLHRRIREAGCNPFPNEAEVGAANAAEGLDLFLAHLSIRRSLDPIEALRVRSLLISTFCDFYAGNRLRSIFVETLGLDNVAMAVGGGFEIEVRFGDPESGHCFLRVDLEGALAVQNYHLARLLHHRPPVLRFPPGGREALRLAIQGLTDGEAQRLHGISASSLTSRWNRLFDIVEDTMPELFGGARGRRSRERLPLLAYVRAHPEELWPYEPS